MSNGTPRWEYWDSAGASDTHGSWAAWEKWQKVCGPWTARVRHHITWSSPETKPTGSTEREREGCKERAHMITEADKSLDRQSEWASWRPRGDRGAAA